MLFLKLSWFFKKCLTGNGKELGLIRCSIVVQQRLSAAFRGTGKSLKLRMTYLLPPLSRGIVTKGQAASHFTIETIKAVREFVDDQVASVKWVSRITDNVLPGEDDLTILPGFAGVT